MGCIRDARRAGASPAIPPASPPMSGPAKATRQSRTAVHCCKTQTTTTVSVPIDAPTRPPSSPNRVDSIRNWLKTCVGLVRPPQNCSANWRPAPGWPTERCAESPMNCGGSNSARGLPLRSQHSRHLRLVLVRCRSKGSLSRPMVHSTRSRYLSNSIWGLGESLLKCSTTSRNTVIPRIHAWSQLKRLTPQSISSSQTSQAQPVCPTPRVLASSQCASMRNCSAPP